MADGGCAGGSRPQYYLFSFFLFIDKNNESGGYVNSVVVGCPEKEGEKKRKGYHSSHTVVSREEHEGEALFGYKSRLSIIIVFLDAIRFSNHRPPAHDTTTRFS